MTCWLDSSGRETDYLVAGSFLNLPQVGKYRGKIAGMLMSMFQAMSSDFLYNRVLHLSTSNNSSGEQISGHSYPSPSTTCLTFLLVNGLFR